MICILKRKNKKELPNLLIIGNKYPTNRYTRARTCNDWKNLHHQKNGQQRFFVHNKHDISNQVSYFCITLPIFFPCLKKNSCRQGHKNEEMFVPSQDFSSERCNHATNREFNHTFRTNAHLQPPESQGTKGRGSLSHWPFRMRKDYLAKSRDGICSPARRHNLRKRYRTFTSHSQPNPPPDSLDASRPVIALRMGEGDGVFALRSKSE